MCKHQIVSNNETSLLFGQFRCQSSVQISGIVNSQHHNSFFLRNDVEISGTEKATSLCCCRMCMSKFWKLFSQATAWKLAVLKKKRVTVLLSKSDMKVLAVCSHMCRVMVPTWNLVVRKQQRHFVVVKLRCQSSGSCSQKPRDDFYVLIFWIRYVNGRCFANIYYVIECMHTTRLCNICTAGCHVYVHTFPF